jgi:hypothetical protein
MPAANTMFSERGLTAFGAQPASTSDHASALDDACFPRKTNATNSASASADMASRIGTHKQLGRMLDRAIHAMRIGQWSGLACTITLPLLCAGTALALEICSGLAGFVSPALAQSLSSLSPGLADKFGMAMVFSALGGAGSFIGWAALSAIRGRIPD